MRRELKTAALALLIFTLALGVVFPLVIWGISQLAFPGAANGQQVKLHGRLVGSAIIGQSFTLPVLGKDGRPAEVSGRVLLRADPLYFQSRPSATEPLPDNGAASTFSNLGPNGILTETEDARRIREYLALNRPYDPTLSIAQIPVDAVTASASGLDPEISIANADIQAHRVAALRHLPLAAVLRLVARHTSSRFLGFAGNPSVNVLELNLALERIGRTRASGARAR
ncbi:MAG TPA: potassium-transporting ATPase subunit C [Solirubrobacteraceae bacterium]|nr:potassium-transporting ATPase subunit C [Solirubrobacteraceae bacterium]